MSHVNKRLCKDRDDQEEKKEVQTNDEIEMDVDKDSEATINGVEDDLKLPEGILTQIATHYFYKLQDAVTDTKSSILVPRLLKKINQYIKFAEWEDYSLKTTITNPEDYKTHFVKVDDNKNVENNNDDNVDNSDNNVDNVEIDNDEDDEGDIYEEGSASGEFPPLGIVLSSIANVLGEFHLDLAMEEGFPQKLLQGVNVDKALHHFTQALTIWMHNPSALLSLALMKRDMGEYQVCLTYLKQLTDQQRELQEFQEEQKERRKQIDNDDDDKKESVEKEKWKIPIEENAETKKYEINETKVDTSNDDNNDDDKFEDDEDDEDDEDEDEDEDDDDDDDDGSWYYHWVVLPQKNCISIGNMHHSLLLSQLGYHKEAKQYISRFFSPDTGGYRLCPEVWDLACSSPEKLEYSHGKDQSEIDKDSPCNYFFEAVPKDLYSILLNAFDPNSAYWRETGYNGAKEYFSFYVDLKNTSGHKDNAVERLIRNNLLPLTGRKDIVGAEWWVHTRIAGRNHGHQLHYDMEEGILEHTGVVEHPILSSVVYLTGSKFESQTGGPTLVLNQNLKSKEMAKEAWLAFPQDRSFVTFSGDLLHGVLPGYPGADNTMSSQPGQQQQQHSEQKPEHRLTLLVAWWNQETQKRAPRRLFGSQSEMPKVSDSMTWPRLLALPSDNFNDNARSSAAENDATASQEKGRKFIKHLKPGWEKIENESGLEVPLPHGIDCRFFLTSPLDIKKRLLKEHCNVNS